MRMNPDSNQEDPLLDAVLRDEDWQAANAALKAEAMGTFRRRQRLRCITRWTGWGLGLAAVIVVAAHWFARQAVVPQRIARQQTGLKPGTLRLLTDEELLASFPKGSCVLAEINGHKELIFLDPNQERIFMAKSD
ncbi:MAG: hypothetical protein NT154_15680 [Verrucomicrobia bacterium]|nr:hypothetical protein [Verrucomicrobiota bacterium]